MSAMRRIGTWVSFGVFLGGLIVGPAEAEAPGSRWGVCSLGPGIGSNPRLYSVRAYIRRDGSHTSPHWWSTLNPEWRHNWNVRGNTIPYTEKDGSRVSPPNSKGWQGPDRQREKLLDYLCADCPICLAVNCLLDPLTPSRRTGAREIFIKGGWAKCP